jgi:hypothetical protein
MADELRQYINNYNTPAEQTIYNNPIRQVRINTLLNREEVPPLEANLRNLCQAITPDNSEPEYQGVQPLPVSSFGTSNNVIRTNHLPRGSALMTGAGNLETRFAADNNNIKAIIHAAPESFATCGNSENIFLQGVALAVKNSIILAKKNGHHRVAIPFIGSAIFGGGNRQTNPDGGCDREKLAKVIVYSAINQCLKEGNINPYFIY